MSYLNLFSALSDLKKIDNQLSDNLFAKRIF